MKNLFVPYELALELKDKGFDEPCLATYDRRDTDSVFIEEVTDYELERNSVYDAGSEDPHESVITAPTWQQVIDWFRDNHKCLIYIEPLSIDHDVSGIIGHAILMFDDPHHTDYMNSPTRIYRSIEYYKCLEEAIQNALYLI